MTPLSGWPRMLTAMTKGNVSSRAMAQNAQAARNFPSTAWPWVMGRVSNSSMVPRRRSSAQRRMVIAGISSRKDPWNEGEERVQISLAAVEELPEVEGQRALQHQEDDNEHRGHRALRSKPRSSRPAISQDLGSRCFRLALSRHEKPLPAVRTDAGLLMLPALHRPRCGRSR